MNISGIIKTNGIKFDVITTDNEILFMDENGGSLTWELNDINLVLVDAMIKEITA